MDDIIDNWARALGVPKKMKLLIKKDWEFTLDLSTTCLNRLSFACGLYFTEKGNRGDKFIKASYLFHSRKWMLLVFASTAVVLIITFIIRYYY